jgi:hypothetical protein
MNTTQPELYRAALLRVLELRIQLLARIDAKLDRLIEGRPNEHAPRIGPQNGTRSTRAGSRSLFAPHRAQSALILNAIQHELHHAAMLRVLELRIRRLARIDAKLDRLIERRPQ